ncbi:hypothetical protein ADL22_17455 [Streptomyces sp. NRRL F-4489]|uniref:hypothetical protein n=1 Tax=Streptomyces sp. NRRL F-4489 TaxID=1609095 RepID=UPI000749059F|nr:hypothetical protein [Streptomyces sp. NRRL F-4489]KUL38692.1 hypothetical protein ADL22_17455 [Streptomyces sp. NRRL F-4489]
MRTMLRRAAALVAGTAAVAVLTVGTADAAPAGTSDGCPYGAVCVYPQGQNPATTPNLIFWTYGAHNLSGQYGFHWILNNQYGGARAKLCSGYNGTGTCHHDMDPQDGWWTDLTPVNSIVLYK